MGKAIGDVKLAVSGAGAAAIACLDVMVGLGVRRENIFVCDSKGVVREGRDDFARLDESKLRYCQRTEARTLADIVAGADVFLGCSAAGVLSAEMVLSMGPKPNILALAKDEASDEVAAAYQGKELRFGPDYLIPTPFDVRLILRIAPAVARAAVESGVATRPITDYDAYRLNLSRFVYQTGMFMRPVFEATKAFNRQHKARVVFAEGEDECVLRAVQVVLEEGLARPVLVGRPEVVKMRIARSNTLIASLMLRRGEADALLVCGLEEPMAEELADIAQMAAAEVRRFGMPPKVAFLSHSIFGSSQRASAQRMRAAHALF